MEILCPATDASDILQGWLRSGIILRKELEANLEVGRDGRKKDFEVCKSARGILIDRGGGVSGGSILPISVRNLLKSIRAARSQKHQHSPRDTSDGTVLVASWPI